MDEPVKAGSENSPCNTCGVKDKVHCPNYQACERYRDWINLCWNGYRKFYDKYTEDNAHDNPELLEVT